MSRRYKILCGVPDYHCQGGILSTDQQLGTKKAHGSHEDAFRCYARYLVKVLGFTRVGAREFQNPNNGPIRVLTKKSRFGTRLMAGKGGDKGSRYMPRLEEAGNRGVIVG